MNPLIGDRRAGSIQVLCIVCIFFVAMSGFGVWGVLRHWRFLVETQLRLNRCIGTVALDFRSTLNHLEKSNRRIRSLRAAIVAAHLQPETIPPLRTTLELSVAEQDWVLGQWQAKQAVWMVSFGCGNGGDLPMPLPSLGYFREPPDWIGSNPLQWVEMPKEFHFQVSHHSRHAAARVSGRVHEAYEKRIEGEGDWFAQWTVPQRFRRSNIY